MAPSSYKKYEKISFLGEGQVRVYQLLFNYDCIYA